jgi:cyclic pyranopterin phosphate synthase
VQRPAPEAPAAAPATGVTGEQRLVHDAQGRRITYLRVSLTDRCNFRCRYCMPPEGIHKLAHGDMLSLEELAALIGVLVSDLGIEKVRITGGEPLVRRGVIGFVRAVAAIPGLRDLALTTNAYFLDAMAADLYGAGVRRLNISLDTLRRDRFTQVTGVDGLAEVHAGIERARETGFSPIKLNIVITRENLDEASELVRFAIARDLQPRFIELMPSHEGSAAQFVAAAELRAHLAQSFHLEPVQNGEGAQATRRHAAARLYRIDGGAHCCGFIAPISGPFCDQCNRIRVRGDGQMLPCLSEDRAYDLKPYIRPHLRAAALGDYTREVLAASKGHTPSRRRIQAMWRIGG